jgi:hypothetical protein
MTEPITRRTTMQWVVAAAASPFALSGCGDPSGWREVRNAPVTAAGYGMDPDLMNPETPWPLTMSEADRAIVRAAADLILPADDRSPSAGSLGVDAFVDEWISAPYERQRQDRDLILSGLVWLDGESRRRFDTHFAEAGVAQQRAIFDDIAFRERVKQHHERPAEFFGRLRGLLMAGFYTLPEGIADLGYLGNSPIQGVYPGPSPEALDHLNGKLAELGLALPRGLP